MKTLITLGKLAALVCSPLLLGLYVYDRSGGNVFGRLLGLQPADVAPAEQGAMLTVATPLPTAAGTTPTPAAEPTLFSGSKSFSGHTVIDVGTLHVAAPSPQSAAPIAPPTYAAPDVRVAAMERMQLDLGTSRTFSRPFRIPQVQVGNPDVAGVQALSPSEIQVVARGIGTTTIIVWDEAGAVHPIELVVASPPPVANAPSASQPPSKPTLIYSTKSAPIDLTPRPYQPAPNAPAQQSVPQTAQPQRNSR